MSKPVTRERIQRAMDVLAEAYQQASLPQARECFALHYERLREELTALPDETGIASHFAQPTATRAHQSARRSKAAPLP
ncbi:hypothetical protein [Oceanicella sp. SM1341]|uniref:hypothetical protein n=1 Tax=Oceanicella sp. SM1341 TaxID=1548889 RepID=UPI000E49E214|nr:hypothetical protein [Oceanicella sp. SM1341]